MSLANIEKGGRAYFFLICLCCCFYLPGLTTLPVTDRDEARFAQASRQMLESKDYVNIRFQDTARNKKPIGIHWFQAVWAGLMGGPQSPVIWAYRIPSVLGAIITVLLTSYFGQIFFNRKVAFLAAALLGTSLLLTVEAHLAKTDAFLLACIVAMQGALGRIYIHSSENKNHAFGSALLFWIACGLGILVKGPVAPGVAFLSIVTLVIADRQLGLLRALRPAIGAVILAVLVLPWVVAIARSTQGAFFKDAFLTDILPKLISAQESHGAPPGYYAVLFLFLFWPASLLAVWAVRPSLKRRLQKPIRFCLAWIAPTWILFEIIPTKLPHYVLPTFPAISLLTAYCLYNVQEPFQIRMKPGFLKWIPISLWYAFGGILAIGITILPLVFARRFFPISLIPMMGCLIILILMPRYWRSGKLLRAAAVAIPGSLMVIAPLIHSILPNLERLWLSREVFHTVQRHFPDQKPVLLSIGYEEPSLVFMMGTSTRLTNPEQAVKYLKKNPPALVLLQKKKSSNFKTLARQAGLVLKHLKTIEGLNYSKGKWLFLELYALEGN